MIADRKSAADMLAGCLYSLGVQVGLWLAVGVLCLIGAVGGALIGGMASTESGSAALGGLAGAGACTSLGVMAMLTFAFLWQVRRGKRAEEALSPLGLIPKDYLFWGRQAHGEIGGRQVDAYFVAQGLNQQLELYVKAQAQTRLTITLRGVIGQAAQKSFNPDWLEMTSAAGLDHLLAAGSDKEWSRKLLGDSGVRSALERLMHAPGAREGRSLSITPEAVYWLGSPLPGSALTTDNVRQWLRDLATIAEAAEKLPAPTNPEAEMPIEAHARQTRGQGVMRTALIITAVLVGGSMLCAVPVIAAIVLIAYLSG